VSDSNGKAGIGSPVDLDPESAQTTAWKGDFGRESTDRNTLDMAALEAA
jgi:hypothetical protein